MPKETGKELLEKAKKLCEKEGREGWKLAQETMLKEKTSSPELQEAIKYLMTKCQPDVFRPALLSLCSKAVKGTSNVTAPVGASLILLARAIGIHDDIIDQSKTKDERLTVLGKFGSDITLVLSDILLFRGFTSLRRALESGTSVGKVMAILSTIEKIWIVEQSDAEALDLKFRRQIDVTPQQCLTKIRMIASEIEAIARIGGILGEGTENEIMTLGKYGRLLGTMALLRDEIVDMFRFKTLKHRIKKETLPLPLVYTLQTQFRHVVISLVSKARLTTRDLEGILKFSEEAGGIEKTANLLEKMVKEAHLLVSELKMIRELKLLASSTALRLEEWEPINTN